MQRGGIKEVFVCAERRASVAWACVAAYDRGLLYGAGDCQ